MHWLRRVEVFVVVVVIAFIGIVYAVEKAEAPTNQPQQQVIQTQTNVITYQGQDGKNALELLKSLHRVETKSYSFGDFVSSIDGVAPDSAHFWALYVNGSLSQVGASQYITKSSDTIKWQIDAVESTGQ